MVLFLVSLEDFFKAAQHSLEALPVNRGHSASVNGLDTGLSADVMEKSQLSEVVALLVLVDDSRELVIGFLLLCNQVALQHNIELVTTLALLDDILAVFKLFFLQDVIELLSEIKK